jgi:superfamily I DNA and/or RNA helicase
MVNHFYLYLPNHQGVSPRIMLVEEAGQVLEAHVLGSLVPSVEQLILIGDPLQLRPTLNNYGL